MRNRAAEGKVEGDNTAPPVVVNSEAPHLSEWNGSGP